MTKVKEWVREYHTTVVGTLYHVKVEGGSIVLEALDKPYKLRLTLDSIRSLL